MRRAPRPRRSAGEAWKSTWVLLATGGVERRSRFRGARASSRAGDYPDRRLGRSADVVHDDRAGDEVVERAAAAVDESDREPEEEQRDREQEPDDTQERA